MPHRAGFDRRVLDTKLSAPGFDFRHNLGSKSRPATKAETATRLQAIWTRGWDVAFCVIHWWRWGHGLAVVLENRMRVKAVGMLIHLQGKTFHVGGKVLFWNWFGFTYAYVRLRVTRTA